MRRLLVPLLLALLSWPHAAGAQTGSETFGDYRVHYSVFNSTFLRPELARLHSLTRAEDRSLLNISVVPLDGGAGVPAEISGSATNLMQQQQTLSFREIDEPDATYYIAPVRHLDEEKYHFRIQVQPKGSKQSTELNFALTLYHDS